MVPSPVSAVSGNPVPVNLGTAESYSALVGAASLTNGGTTALTGNLGLSPAGAVTENGTLSYLAINNGNAAASQAYADMGTAYNDALGRTSTPNSFPATGGGTYFAGVYNQGGASAPAGTMTLDGQNDPNSVFIFQIGGAFAPSGQMLLTNGAQSGNVFWQVNGAVAPGAGSTTVGTIMARGAFSLGAGATVSGRVLVTGAGTFSTNTITTTSPMTIPGAPTSVTAVAGVASATVSWNAPSNNGGATLDSYTVTSSPGAFTCTTANGSTTSCSVTGLTNGTAYTFTVTARNSVGTSLASSASNMVHPTPTPTPTPTGEGGGGDSHQGNTNSISSPVYDLLQATRLPQRATTVFLGGEPMAAVFTINHVNGTVNMSSDGLDIKIGLPTTKSSDEALDSSGTLNLVNGSFFVSTCSGFHPGTEITYFLVNTKMAVSLGKLPVAGNGTCSGKVPLPIYLIKGVYTLQIEGLVNGNRLRTATTQLLSVSIRVNVITSADKQVAKSAGKPEAKPSTKQDARKQRIQFEPYSAKLTKDAKEQLRVMVQQLPNKTRNFVRIVGFVSAGGSPSHASELGNTRSKSVQRYLASRGVRGTYVLKLGGNTVKNTQQAPHARVTIYPNQ